MARPPECPKCRSILTRRVLFATGPSPADDDRYSRDIEDTPEWECRTCGYAWRDADPGLKAPARRG